MKAKQFLIAISFGLASCSLIQGAARSNPATTMLTPKSLIADKASAKSDQSIPAFSGNASWYGIPFHGRKTASGELFDMNKLSAAHKTLPFPTKVMVENPRNGQSVVVRVIDRGPYVRGRVLDLSREAAKRVGIFPGVGYVEATVLSSKVTAQDKK
jgi:rare lipoprotein A